MTDLYHYFDRSTGPFLSLSTLSLDAAEHCLASIRTAGSSFAAQRSLGYLARRREIETLVRALFVAQGGQPILPTPHYLVWDHCPWLDSWYQHPDRIAIPLEAFDPATVSFTYGDSFPTFSPNVTDNREIAKYRRRVYSLDEIQQVIARFGLPQHWNPEGKHGPERYVEAHLWSNNPVVHYRDRWRAANFDSRQLERAEHYCPTPPYLSEREG